MVGSALLTPGFNPNAMFTETGNHVNTLENNVMMVTSKKVMAVMKTSSGNLVMFARGNPQYVQLREMG